MRRLHYMLLLLILWLSLVLNLDWLAPSLSLAPLFYVFLPVASVLTIWSVTRYNIPLPVILGALLLMYIIPKLQFGVNSLEDELPKLVFETSIIGVTLLLSVAIGWRLAEIRSTLANLVIGQSDDEIVAFEKGQSALYREVRRARRRNHSLALLAVSPPQEHFGVDGQPSADGPFPGHIVSEMQLEFGKKYVLTRLGRLLLDELEDSAVITQTNEHFIVLLPETTRDELQAVIRTLQSTSNEKLKLKLNIGSATFPDEEITLESLIERAEAGMREAPVKATHQMYETSPTSVALATVDSSTKASSIS